MTGTETPVCVVREHFRNGAPAALANNNNRFALASLIARAAAIDALRLHFAGRVEYKDVFGATHNTWFCHTFRGAEMTPATYRHGQAAD